MSRLLTYRVETDMYEHPTFDHIIKWNCSQNCAMTRKLAQMSNQVLVIFFSISSKAQVLSLGFD